MKTAKEYVSFNKQLSHPHSSTSSSSLKRKKKDDDDDDDKNNILSKNGNEFFVNKSALNRTKKIGNKIRLPGGYARKVVEVTENTTYNIRAYLDVIFGTLAFEALRHSDNVSAIPTLVSNILKHNNIFFANVYLQKTQMYLHEPLWYMYDLNDRTLRLFVNEEMYNDYCLTNLDANVLWKSGEIRVDHYNPFKQNPEFGAVDQAQIKCAIACDHVAQHIIHELNDEPLDTEEIHENWTNSGTTLHSMFDLEVQTTSSDERTRMQEQFITFLSQPTTSSTISSLSSPMSLMSPATSSFVANGTTSTITAATAPPPHHHPSSLLSSIRLNNVINCDNNDLNPRFSSTGSSMHYL